MLISYSSQIGSETMMSVMISAVGVMMAAMMRMATIAWRRYSLIHDAFNMPKRASSHEMTGISKTMPKTRLMSKSVST